MKLQVATLTEKALISDLLILFLDKKYVSSRKRDYQFLPQNLASELDSILAYRDFNGEKNEHLLCHVNDGQVRRILLIGTGEHCSPDPEQMREYGFTIFENLKKVHGKRAHILLTNLECLPDEALAGLTEGVLLSDYSFNDYKTAKDQKKFSFHSLIFLFAREHYSANLHRTISRIEATIAGVNVARDLANLPGNELTPLILAARTRKLFADSKTITVDVLDAKQIESLKMGAFMAMAKGSNNPPVMLVLRYESGIKGARTMALVGKGVTFDSGGISIKPSAKMEEMKYDMAGAAAVIGTMRAIEGLLPENNVVAVIPAAENMPSGTACRPGDVVRAYNGKTIEIINTDAEGRMLLADALAYTVDKYKPDCVIDLATLTGSIMVAIGNKSAGLFTNSEGMADWLLDAADESGERLWNMPMWKEYRKDIDSKVADLKNVSDGREAGSITAAKFLEEFIDGTPWAHLDIAGTSNDVSGRKYLRDGATGYGVRLLSAFLKSFKRQVKNI
jgi:leucyl aminopeptidase